MKREFDRVYMSYVKGMASEEETTPVLTKIREEREALKAELAAMAPPENVIALHPGAVKRYLAMVNDLATSLPHRTIAGDEAISIALRELVSCVTVTPTKKAPPKISVTGRLAALVGGELFPHSRGYHHVGFPRKLRTCSMWPEILTLIHRCDTGRPTRR